jgi:hypothetical protein
MAFATAIDGYPGASFLASVVAGKYWFSLIDNNMSDPDAGGSSWIPFDPTGSATTGDVKFRPTAEDIPGWIKANALSIGNASSGATSLASPTTRALFRWHWLNFPNTQCPVLPGGRGANPDADFDANKTIQVLDWRGTGFMGMDTMAGGATNRLAGVPVVSGNATSPGSVLGENLHTLTVPETASHNHGGVTGSTQPGATSTVSGGVLGGTGQAQGAGPSDFFITGASGIVVSTVVQNHAHSIALQGDNGAHNTVERVIAGTVHLKL